MKIRVFKRHQEKYKESMACIRKWKIYKADEVDLTVSTRRAERKQERNHTFQ